MKLIYHRGKNFGDALNPLIFERFLPNFFSEDSAYGLLGIGSILGLKRPEPNQKLIVFSSGYGGGDIATYGNLPTKKELERYDFRCVRGPLTAMAIGLDLKLSVCDGAILTPEVFPNNQAKQFKYSYIPHLGSLAYYSNWNNLLDSIGIHIIDPRKEVEHVLKEIQQTEILLAEAMHGAIIADAYRIPWIPVKSNPTINTFKWTDFCHSLNLEYEPNEVKTLFDSSFTEGIFKAKFSSINSGLLNKSLAKGYSTYQKLFVESAVVKRFNEIKTSPMFLSDEQLIRSKTNQLKEILQGISKDYSNH